MTRNTALCERNVTEAFKDAFRAHPAGVAIITAKGSSGPVGLTASSVSSVSAEPPMTLSIGQIGDWDSTMP